MPFVERNAQNKVIGRYATLQPGYAEEWLDDGHPDLLPPAPTPEEIALAARKATDSAEAASVKVDNQVQTFLNFTPAELDAWVDANITGAGNKTAFKVLGRLAQAAARGKVLR